ncbi:MAG: hypothetical protein IPP71_13495 [Bacteroidetes bacterium]|nr:hypothetical protein [Bacteroidota bacterium]
MQEALSLQAGSTAVNFLAKWDGTSWSDVNGDMGNQVAALTVYNNDLIVGGYFTDADGFPANYIVGWNSNGWFNLWNRNGRFSRTSDGSFRFTEQI